MFHLNPLSTISLASIKLLHVYKGLLPKWASKKLVLLKYFAFKTLWTRESGFWMICHPCLAKSAKLNALRSLNPSPPSAFLWHIFSHETQAIFHSFSFCPHQKFLTMEFSSWHKESGILKQVIVYVGVAWATALMSTSLPAFESNLPFHPAIFLLTWSFIWLKAFLFPLPTSDGSPRCF